MRSGDHRIGNRPVRTEDLLRSERRFLTAIQELGFGRLEFVRIRRGELVLDPWPTTVRNVKFGSARRVHHDEHEPEFALKKQVAEFFEYIRAMDSGELRMLEVHDGLPFSMEIEQRPVGVKENRHA